MDHTALNDRLDHAKSHCSSRGLRFTPARREVYELLLRADGPVGAYDLLERLSIRRGRPQAPPTVYRALEFLVAAGLAHRVEPLNAFIACLADGAHAAPQLLICDGCHGVQELHSEPLEEAVSQALQRAGAPADLLEIAIRYRCPDCARQTD